MSSDSIRRGKMKQILIAYGPSEETVTAIMILYKNTKEMVHLPDGDTDLFDVVADFSLACFIILFKVDAWKWETE